MNNKIYSFLGIVPNRTSRYFLLQSNNILSNEKEIIDLLNYNKVKCLTNINIINNKNKLIETEIDLMMSNKTTIEFKNINDHYNQKILDKIMLQRNKQIQCLQEINSNFSNHHTVIFTNNIINQNKFDDFIYNKKLKNFHCFRDIQNILSLINI
jgi:hypothetical protein